MTKQKTPEPDKSRLDELEEDIEKVREREERRREEAAEDRMRFATPEAYEAEMERRKASETEQALKQAADKKPADAKRGR